MLQIWPVLPRSTLLFFPSYGWCRKALHLTPLAIDPISPQLPDYHSYHTPASWCLMCSC